MSQTRTIAAELRTVTGKGASRAVRLAEKVPGIVYGGGAAPMTISVGTKLLTKEVTRGRFFNTLFEIDLGTEKLNAVPRDVQMHPVTDRPVHVDFLRIVPGSRLDIEVPVVFLNQDKAPGIKKGGVMNVVRHVVSLSCPADQIPDRLEADLAGYEINDSLHISAIKLPEGVRPTIRDRDFTIVTIAPPTAAEEKAAAAGPAAAAPAAKGKAAAPAAKAAPAKKK
jgi:large subunit ribosomal protein L25